MRIQYVLTIVVIMAVYATANVKFDIYNKERGAVWVGILGNSGKPNLNGGGFVLNPGQTDNQLETWHVPFGRDKDVVDVLEGFHEQPTMSYELRVTVSAPDNWAGRFWPRTWCDNNSKHCLTGDCGNKLQCNGAGGNPPATLVEITLKGSGGLDFYDISLVDGFNIKASIKPVGGQGTGKKYSCATVNCMGDVNGQCPNELRVVHNGKTIACNSACNKFKTDQYCCAGKYNRPETCKSSTWPHNYPAYFKKQCPDAYSYAYDDHKSTFTCKASHYRIQFGG